MSYVTWLEQHLGEMADGKETDLVAGESRVFVGRYLDRPAEGATTYATVGLSKTYLHQPGGHIRQELLVSRWDDVEFDCARLLMPVVEDILESTDALLRGAVLGPAGPLLPGAKTEALLAWQPVYFDEDFTQYTGDEGHPPIGMTWLIPITADEAAFVREQGPDAFEGLLIERDPDLLDWSRPSVLPRI